MNAMAMVFKDLLDGIFYPSDGNKKKKKDTQAAETGYARSGTDETSFSSFRDKQVCSLYVGSDYPAMMIAGYDDADAERVIAALSAVFPQKPIIATEPLGDRLSALYAFRSDSYFMYTPSATAPNASAPNATVPAAPRPVIFVRKTALRGIEEYLTGGAEFTSPSAILAAAEARPPASPPAKRPA
ncbi:MAG TPA: hypothetical protein PKO22_11160 [Treponemataceae bacterium]|nr:hypothetical protein [Treponemataceae bacterium]